MTEFFIFGVYGEGEEGLRQQYINMRGRKLNLELWLVF